MGEDVASDAIAALGFCARIDQETPASGAVGGEMVDPGTDPLYEDVTGGAEPFYMDVCCD